MNITEPRGSIEMAKQIVLTGGSSGIGLELLKRLLREGHRVAVIARTDSQLNELQNNIRSNDLEGFIADLSIQSDILNASRLIKEKFGRVDILFNNAGVLLGKMITSEQGNEMHYEVNTLSPYVLTLGLKSALAQSSDPLVVNTSTDGLHYAKDIRVSDLISPRKNQPSLNLYLNSKLALLLLLDHISEELHMEGIRVIHVSPGGNKTKLSMGKGMPIWLAPIVRLFYKDPQHGADLLYKAAFDEQHPGKTQIYLQNNMLQKIRCSISDEQISELLSGLKVRIN